MTDALTPTQDAIRVAVEKIRSLKNTLDDKVADAIGEQCDAIDQAAWGVTVVYEARRQVVAAPELPSLTWRDVEDRGLAIVKAIRAGMLPTMDSNDGGEILSWITQFAYALRPDIEAASNTERAVTAAAAVSAIGGTVKSE